MRNRAKIYYALSTQLQGGGKCVVKDGDPYSPSVLRKSLRNTRSWNYALYYADTLGPPGSPCAFYAPPPQHRPANQKPRRLGSRSVSLSFSGALPVSPRWGPT